ncbi:MAG: hypothetical protein HY600_06360 [Candidatus Omnitrophica bacterium]|nr:hypothetical protein [Candidatus Omnitrophota bacterium]
MIVLAVLAAGGITTYAALAAVRDQTPSPLDLDPDALGLPEEWFATASPPRHPGLSPRRSAELLTSEGRGPRGNPGFPLGVTENPAMRRTVVEGTVPPLALVALDFSREPTVRDVQTAAIRYAEVMPEKIQGWRARAAWRSWIPRFTLSLDRDIDTTIGSSSSGGKTTFTVGPEEQSLSFGYGFTWELADLIWNPDQTSIDTRSRLMVLLRNDILDQVTRAYFERRRLQVEYAMIPVREPSLRAERQLRIDELTAQLDALTGGAFSETIRRGECVATR